MVNARCCQPPAALCSKLVDLSSEWLLSNFPFLGDIWKQTTHGPLQSTSPIAPFHWCMDSTGFTSTHHVSAGLSYLSHLMNQGSEILLALRSPYLLSWGGVNSYFKSFLAAEPKVWCPPSGAGDDARTWIPPIGSSQVGEEAQTVAHQDYPRHDLLSSGPMSESSSGNMASSALNPHWIFHGGAGVILRPAVVDSLGTWLLFFRSQSLTDCGVWLLPLWASNS